MRTRFTTHTARRWCEVCPAAGLVLAACHATPPAESAPVVTAVAPVAEAEPPPDIGPVPPGSARPVAWGYGGSVAPATWGVLDPAYALCGNGEQQSPIDLAHATHVSDGDASPRFAYVPTTLTLAHHEHVHDLVDNGHTLQVTVDEGSTLTLAEHTYALKQFHFHAPSEHVVAGRAFPLEAHLVHQDESGAFAVLSVLFEEGEDSPDLQTLIEHFPANKGDVVRAEDVEVSLDFALPAEASSYHYSGSLTTPPCTEGVEWFVVRDPVRASAAQLRAFENRLHHNNRPVQRLHQRPVTLQSLAEREVP